MSKVYTDPQHYSDIASAIRYKNGTETQYKPQNMAEAIRAIGATVAFIKATFTAGRTCTCTKGSVTLNGGTSGTFTFAIPETGTWVVSDETVSQQIAISEYGQKEEVNLTQ